MSTDKPTLGIVGGTGALGSAIAWRAARAGYPTVIGSRDSERAGATAAAAARRLPGRAPVAGPAGRAVTGPLRRSSGSAGCCRGRREWR